MTSKLQRNVPHLALFLGLAILPLISHADDGGGDVNFPAANVMHEPEARTTTLTCAEATAAAWFNRQVEISDGDVSPALPAPAECERSVLAQVSTDDVK